MLIVKSVIICFILHQIWCINDFVHINPHGTATRFAYNDLHFTCRQTNGPVSKYDWIINGTNYDEHDVRFISQHTLGRNHIGELRILKIPPIYNNTEIQCGIISQNTSDEFEVISARTLIILQDIPPSVENLEVTLVGKALINISWVAPFLIIKKIEYILNIYNGTSLKNTTTTQTFLLISSKSSRPLTCDNLNIVITPKNRAGIGPGRHISKDAGALEIVASKFVMNNETRFDLLLSLTASLCSISNLCVQNRNLNDTHIHRGTFTDFSLVNTSRNIYQYVLKLNLKKRFQYQIYFELENRNSSTFFSLITSTHDVNNITFDILSRNELIFEAYNSDGSSSRALIAMLKCQRVPCEDIDFNNSFFIKHNRKNRIYRVNFVSGTYLLFAYDIDPDGKVLFSDDTTNTSYSIESKTITLNYNDTSNSYTPNEKYYCDLKFNNNSLSSICNATDDTSRTAQQQLILQSVDTWNMLYITDSSPICEELCVERGSKDYCAFTLRLDNSSKKQHPEPVGRNYIVFSNITDPGGSNEMVCLSTNSCLTTSPVTTTLMSIPNLSTSENTSSIENKNVTIITSSVMSAVTIVAGVLLIVAVYTNWAKIKDKFCKDKQR